MLGDVVYALGALLLAKFLLPRFVDDTNTEGFKLFQRLLYISGGVALIVGLLTGTYLGDFLSAFFHVPNIALASGIEEALKTPITFILIAIMIGLVHVNLGHLLGFIKGIKERNKSVILGKIGLWALQIGGIPVILNKMLNVELGFISQSVYSALTYVMLAGIILIVIAAIMDKGAFMGGIFWLFDITGILGDVMSYARIAGVGLATYYLAFCFNLIADLFLNFFPGPVGLVVGVIAAFIILILGHLINLALGVLTGFIHSLRLCFVEFLFKFYEGGGRAYSPFKVRTGASFIAGKS
jgi:V/A-type H+-transporting ATPase subunit I